MVNNKRAKQTLALVSSWDKYRATNNKLDNNVEVWLDSKGFIYSLIHKPYNKYIDDFRSQ